MPGKKLKISSFLFLLRNINLKYLYGSLRRRFIYYFLKGYYNRKLAKRRGACLEKGHCCRQTIPWCPHLQENICRLYAQQPLFCRIFPIDEKDQELSGIKRECGYYFQGR